MRINGLHRAVLKDYADGDVAYLAEQEEILPEDISDLGDNLLAFMLIELSEEEDCEDVGTGIERLTHGCDDLDVVLKALRGAPGGDGRHGQGGRGMTRSGGKPPAEAAYGLGLLHGRTPRESFAPREGWSGEEHRAYARGFDRGLDLLIDERGAA